MRQLEFSVIIPTYNRVEMLRDTLASVFQQSCDSYEVIVVDDGSTDGTQAMLAQQGERIVVLQQQQGGPGIARNRGAELARGRYLAFLDSDDLWFPWSLAGYAKIIASCEEPAFIAGSPLRFREALELDVAVQQPLEYARFRDYLESGDEWRWFGVSSFVIRREAFLAVGGFANGWIHAEDADLAMRLGIANGFVHWQRPFAFAYREHSGGATHDSARGMAGIRHLLEQERAGAYPGGMHRRNERWRILSRHVRPFTLGCLESGDKEAAWSAYRASIGWNLRERRYKYLLGFLLKYWMRCKF